MRNSLILLICVYILPMCFPFSSSAQDGKWNGDFGIKGGTNFLMTPANNNSHHLGDSYANFGYSADKFAIGASLSGSYEYLLTTVQGLDSIVVESGNPYVADASADEVRNLLITAGLNGRWSPDKRNHIRLNYTYGYDGNKPFVRTLTDFTVQKGSSSSSFSKKDAKNSVNTHDALLSYQHLFRKSGRELNADVGFTYVTTSHFAEWLEADCEFGKLPYETPVLRGTTLSVYRYRDTPAQDAADGNIGIRFSERNLGDVSNLNLDVSLLTHQRWLSDRKSASSYSDGEWRDSVEARENFYFWTSTLTPRARLRYSCSVYELDFEYSPEYYLQKLDNDSNTGTVDKGKVAHFVSFGNTFLPADGHKIFLNGARGEERPNYLQICWFPRHSLQYSDELYIGDPDLDNSVELKASTGYEYTFKGLYVRWNCEYTHKKAMIEETYSNEIINDKEYRVYRWLNGGKSDEVSNRLSVGWEDDNLTAALEGGYNVYRGVSIEDEETRSGEYSVKALFGYRYKTWDFTADATYNSDIVRTYSTVKSIVECNASVSKSFKKFTIKLEGLNLLDRPIETSTLSEDGTERRYEKVTNNKRMFILGLCYSF